MKKQFHLNFADVLDKFCHFNDPNYRVYPIYNPQFEITFTASGVTQLKKAFLNLEEEPCLSELRRNGFSHRLCAVVLA